MAFNQIPKIEDVTHYFDMALTRAKKTMSESYESTKSAVKDVDHIDRLKQLNKAKLQTIRDTLDKQILLILKAFPSFDQLDEFYQQLVRETMDYPEVKKSLGGLQWARGKIDDFTSMYQKKVRGSRTPADIRKHVTEYIGRCASLFKQLKSNLKTLELARQVLRDYPHIKTGMFTVVLTGFPNVGKSTLLSKVTPAKPKIGDYAFTTTTINIGIAEVEYDRIQILDTPGTLNRVKLNTAELYAQLAMKYVADMIVLVYDASGQYTFEDQEELYRSVDKHGKNVYVFITKTDIPDKELLAQIKKTHKQSFSTYDEFLKVLRVEKRKSNKIE